MKRKLLLAALLATTTTAFAADGPQVKPWGIYLNYMDTAQKPGDDFFVYGNGTWLKTAKIPSDRSYAGVNLEIDKQNEARLRGIVADLSARKNLSPEETKLRDFYNAFVDQKAIDAAGLKPAQADLTRIAALKTPEDVARAMGDPALSLDGPFAMYIAPNDKHPTAYAVDLTQSGLGLPDRDYYLNNDNKGIVSTREAYKKYIAQMLGLAGVKDAGARAAAVFKLESDIALAHWKAEDRRDPDKTYNPMTVADLQKFAPQFPWAVYLSSAGLSPNAPSGPRTLIVAEKSAFPKLAAIFAATPVSVWRDYLTVHYLHGFASYLPKNIDDANFAMYGQVIRGQKVQLDRQTRGLHLLDAEMGEALGKLYTAKYFPPEAKAKAKVLVDNLLKAYVADIKTLSWMTPATREKALNKLHHYILKIGYPDTWRDYSALTITPGQILQDAKNAGVFEWNREVKRIDQPVDRAEWGMTPPTNNAYYNPTTNEICFPAGILQPPYFDAKADDAANYGGIGATIGHEISHGFDDEGAKYDYDGTLRDWWTAQDKKNFEAKTNAIAAQYDQYEPLPGIHIKGKLTNGENIADIAGLVIAYKAYHIALGGKPAPVLNGMTGDQRFYVAYAQSWREIRSEGTTRAQLLSNPHSPAAYRVNGVVRNDNGWYAAFPQIKAGDKYYLPPDKRVPVW
ncbi:MAG TPA: M13 family metallopeptidase [Rhizomicrobium sp.]|nr:M13 family metallopeptidase [Rhizomicrobium sp.]